MSNHQSRERGKSHRRRRDHNFWREWKEEHKRNAETTGRPRGGRRHSPRHLMRIRAQMWRQFFHQYMGEYPEDHWAFRGRRFNPWRQGEDAFNPFVATLLSKGGGLLPLLVLDMLVQKARYGNEIMEEIGRKTDGQWVANPGAIYPLMTVLEEAGLIDGQWEDPRKRTVRVYEITEKGRLELPRLKAIVKPKLDEALAVLAVISADLDNDDEVSETTTL